MWGITQEKLLLPKDCLKYLIVFEIFAMFDFLSKKKGAIIYFFLRILILFLVTKKFYQIVGN